MDLSLAANRSATLGFLPFGQRRRLLDRRRSIEYRSVSAGGPLMFDRLIHADWSVSAGKRWMATAARHGGTWVVEAPAPVGPGAALLDGAFEAAKAQRVLPG